MGTVRGVCAILPDWHSTTFRRRKKEQLKALLTKEGRNILEFLFLKFRLEEEYFSEIRKTAILTEKVTKIRTTTEIVKNSRTKDGKHEASYRGHNAQ